VGDEVGLRDLRAGSDDHVGAHGFPRVGVVDTDDCDLADRRVLEQSFLDLSRVHVEAVDDDEVLAAVDQVELAVVAQHATSPVRSHPSAVMA